MSVVQSDKKSSDESFLAYSNLKHVSLAKVVTLDGVWFCTRKDIALEFPFDEETFKRFHCYDIDFALSVFQVAVTFDILIQHFSTGSFNWDWIDATFKLHKKWLPKLPVNLAGITRNNRFWKSEKHSIRYLLMCLRTITYIKIYSAIYGIRE